MSARITVLPKKVKLLNGIVNNPVTQVAEVAVKKMSIVDICTMCAIGKESNSAPHTISKKNEKTIMCAGDISINVFLLIQN